MSTQISPTKEREHGRPGGTERRDGGKWLSELGNGVNYR